MKKRSRGWLALLLAFVMITAAVGPVNVAKAADKPQFRIVTSNPFPKPGEEFNVELWLEPNSNLTALVLNYTYDADTFELRNYIQGPLANTPNRSTIEPDAGSISILVNFYAGLLDAEETPNTEGGLLLTLVLKVKDNPSGTGNVGIDFRGGMDENKGTVPDGNDNADIQVEDESGKPIEEGNIPINIELKSIALSKTAPFTMAKGTNETLTVTATPEAALQGKTISWSSTNTSAVTVDQDGTLHAVGLGTSRITATVDGKSASVEVTVNAPLKGISLSSPNMTGDGKLTLKKGTSETLSVVYDPEDTTDDRKVTWNSSVPSVATVGNDGKVTALQDGITTITATVGSHQATCELTVQEVKLTGISLDQTNLTVGRGKTAKLTVKYEPENTTDDKTVVWSTDKDTIATVRDGVVTGVGIGDAVITARVGNYTATCNVKVNAPLESLELAPSLVVLKNERKSLKVSFNPEDTTDDKKVTWKIKDDSVAELIEDGSDNTTVTIVGKRKGETDVIVTGANNVSATCKIIVDEIPIAAIELNPAKATVEKGETVDCTVTFRPADTTDDKIVTWDTSDQQVATVEATGDASAKITAVGGGSAIITAKTANGRTAECVITVPIHMTGIQLTGQQTILKKQKSQMTVVYEPANTTDDRTVTWESSANDVATVDANGVVTGIKAGTATIKATTAVKVNGQPLTAEFEVIVVEIPMTDIEINQETSTQVPLGREGKIKVDPVPASTTDDLILEYTSSDDEILKIDADGTMHGLKAGKATVTVKTTDGRFEKTFEVEVIVIPLEGIEFVNPLTSMPEGTTARVEVAFKPADTTDDTTITWSSSDPSVATIENGVVKALKAGKTTITAKVGDKEISYELTVTAKATGSDNKGPNTNNTQSSQSGNRAVATGDEANILLYVALLIFSLSVISVIVVKRRRAFR